MMDAVLVIDSAKQSFQQLKTLLEFIECESVIYTNPDEWRTNQGEPAEISAIFLATDIESGAQVLVEEIKEWSKDIPLILLARHGQNLQFPAVPAGTVLRVLEYPFKYQDVVNSLHQARVFKNNQTQPAGSYSVELFRSLVGNSRGIRRVRTMIEQVASSEATVLILGESGTGKEVVARNIHYYSDRREKPFVPLNCGAIPADLLESELFGHEKGAFTGAISSRQGRFELADGGTLFLDEIGDMTMHMQVKLLRVLQERNFSRVGSNKLIHANVRIVAATHRNLEEAIEKGDFREDLYYRLNVFPIDMPPLRDRIEDIPLLVNELVKRLENENRGSVRLTHAALMSLCQYQWPGNVRELANLIERLVIMYPFGVVDSHDLPDKFQTDPVGLADSRDLVESMLTFDPYEEPRLPREGIDLKEHLADLEYKLIKQALDDADGVVAHAANRLKLRRTTLVEKLRKFDLQRSGSMS
jgi:sigma-54 specific flagellar transcriptional regulator A